MPSSPACHPPTCQYYRLLTGALRGAGALLARGEASLLRLCKAAVEGAPAGSWRLRLLGALATGPFRGSVLRFYASASDHTRRLTSVRANSKFLSPSSGPDSALNVRPAPPAAACMLVLWAFGLEHSVCVFAPPSWKQHTSCF